MNKTAIYFMAAGLLISAHFGPPVFFAGAAEGITQGEWAAYLARGLGLEKALPEGTSADRFVSALGQGGYTRIEGEDYQEAAESLRKAPGPESLVVSRGQWLEAADASGVARYRFDIPIDREAFIRARIRGDPQFWTVNEGASIMVISGEKLDWREVGKFNLKAGEHQVAVSIPPGGVLDLFELVGGATPAIEPPAGFNLLAPLTYGDKAVTIVRGLNLESELPIDGGFYLIREAELYDQGRGGYLISRSRRPGPPSRGQWVKPEAKARVDYNFEVPERGLYSLLARGFGRFEEEWTIDLGVEKAFLRPINPVKFGWFPVATVFLDAGPHTLEIKLHSGNGFDVFQVIRHRAGVGDYLQLLSDLGLQEGALPASPEADYQRKRRYLLYRSLEGEEFAAAAGAVEKSADRKYGEPSNQEWIGPRGGEVTIRYLVKMAEEGTYALYMRSFGESPLTWKIDPAGESFREKREVFPRAPDAFFWQEVVTLDLEEGEHIFEVTIPEAGGMDVFELRKQPWPAADLDLLARQPVSREEALRNLEEVEERREEPEEETPEEPEEEPEEPEKEEYPPLSPYVPGG